MLYVCTVFLQKRKERESVVLKSKKLSDDAKKKSLCHQRKVEMKEQ